MNTTIAQPSDSRWQAIYFGLNQLTNEQLNRILTHHQAGGEMCCDTFNYDPARELWCPLAVGLDVPRLAKLDKTQKRDNAWGKTLITEIGRTTNPGFTLNPVSGIPGAFFRDHRERDIVATCEHILQERFQIRIAA